MGTPPDFGDVQPLGCKGKIDFLFVISRGGPIISEQEQLIASVPGFIDTITAEFSDFDTHIMVANPDGTWPGWICETPELCGKDGSCGETAEDYQCGPATWELLTACDETLGAGILFNAGGYATNKPCDLYGGNRYMVLPGQPDPAAAFDCIARVGMSGGHPKLATALLEAISPKLNKNGACNAGFLRPDALLVVTLITDIDDEYSYAGPAYWYDEIVKIKDPNSVVMLAIIPQPPGGENPIDCGSNKPYRVRDLILKFPFHAQGNICFDSFAPFFQDAVGLVGEACDSFIPQ